VTTRTEKNIGHRRKRNGILVPLLEDLLRYPVRIETDRDAAFIQQLLRKGQQREQRRSETPVFSPSSMSACLRQVYLTRHHHELEIPKLKSTRIEPNFYYLTGEWLHLKWQYACWKLQERINDPKIFRLIACEYPILSKRGDHGGTVDVFCLIYDEPLIVDFKGLNVRDFGRVVREEASGYEIQLTDYMMLFNSQPQNHYNGNRIERSLLLVENKGGPDNRHPIALHETVIELADYKKLVQHRLGVLREYEAKEEIPPPECTSVSTFQFQGCPFRKYCKAEVKKIQDRNKRAKGSEGAYKVARPEARKAGRKRR
jgi:hypothetical protein